MRIEGKSTEYDIPSAFSKKIRQIFGAMSLVRKVQNGHLSEKCKMGHLSEKMQNGQLSEKCKLNKSKEETFCSNRKTINYQRFTSLDYFHCYRNPAMKT